MKRKHRRLALVAAAVSVLAAAVFLVLFAVQDSIVFYREPTEVAAGKVEPGRRFRLGGLVEEGSVARLGDQARFRITDLSHTVEVSYRGLLPDLFREGQGVIAEGRIDAAGVFQADTILAKHDETYMPKEVAESLKKSGKWQPAEETP